MNDKDKAKKVSDTKESAKLRILADKKDHEGKAKRYDVTAGLLDQAHWEITDLGRVLVWLEGETTKHDSIFAYSSVGVTAEYLASVKGVNIAVAYTKADESGMRKFSIIGYEGAPDYWNIMLKLHAAESTRGQTNWYSSWPGFSIDNKASRLEPEAVLQVIREVL